MPALSKTYWAKIFAIYQNMGTHFIDPSVVFQFLREGASLFSVQAYFILL